MYDLKIDGFMSESELQIIEEWSKRVPENGVVVELGSYKGRSSYCWAKSIPESATLYCIDHWPFPDDFDIFKKNVECCTNIKIINGFSPSEINYTNELIDIFFIDAKHKNPNDLQNILFYKEFLKPKALICGHDHSKHWPDVITNVNLLEKYYKTKKILYPPYSLWAIQT